ncbi:MAG: alpha/beta fold hydrolase [Chloroflexi bacterium CFX4]|nr:alpha/beta fold hydrolase [Chloroflexi bacterium CFX4]MDL1923297.1 alpha/beta fold hydrolase [Chloroflexi bacterium CFX3]
MNALCLLPILALIGFYLACYLVARALIRPPLPSPPNPPSDYGLAFEAVRFPSRDGLGLSGWWIPAAQPTERTIIICHGRDGSRDRETPHAETLHTAGFNVLMFDFRAHGDSEGEQVTFGMYERDDLLGALDFLAGRGIGRAGVLGFSLGATTAILTAAVSDRIAVIVAEGAVVRLKNTLARRFWRYGVPYPLGWLVAAWSLATATVFTRGRMDQVDAIRWIPHLKAPILLIHGAADDLISAAEVAELAVSCGSWAVVWQVAGAGHHEASQVAAAAFKTHMLAWFDQHLPNTHGAAAQTTD